MSETLHPLLTPPAQRLNVLDQEQMYAWMDRLQVTEEQLRNAAFISGPQLKDIRNYLVRHGHIDNERFQ